MCDIPGEKDRANSWLARTLVGTNVDIPREIVLVVQHPVTPRHVRQAVQKLTTMAFR